MVVSWKHKGIHVDFPQVVYTLDIRVPTKDRVILVIPIDTIDPQPFPLKGSTTHEEQNINT
jgi:hypothetical protein